MLPIAAGAAAFFNPLYAGGFQRPTLAATHRPPRARAPAPLGTMREYEEYRRRLATTTPAPPDSSATRDDAEETIVPDGSIMVAQGARVLATRPKRIDQRPALKTLVEESSDMLSHQAIMENFVRRGTSSYPVCESRA